MPQAPSNPRCCLHRHEPDRPRPDRPRAAPPCTKRRMEELFRILDQWEARNRKEIERRRAERREPRQ